jgi:hypothetical protein
MGSVCFGAYATVLDGGAVFGVKAMVLGVAQRAEQRSRGFGALKVAELTILQPL